MGDASVSAKGFLTIFDGMEPAWEVQAVGISGCLPDGLGVSPLRGAGLLRG